MDRRPGGPLSFDGAFHDSSNEAKTCRMRFQFCAGLALPLVCSYADAVGKVIRECTYRREVTGMPLAGQTVGISEVTDPVWLVSFLRDVFRRIGSLERLYYVVAAPSI